MIPVEVGGELLLPVCPGTVPAGFPSPAADYIEERIDLNKHLIKHPSATYFIVTGGDSMINAFIPPKAMLLVDRAIEPENGDIVYAEFEGEFTVKYLRKNELKAWLVPANPKYREMEIRPESNCIIWGVVTAIITNPKDVRHVGFGRC